MALTNFQVSKILTGYDVTKKAGLPMKIVEHMDPIMNGEKSMELTAFDRWGQPWPLIYYSCTLRTGKKKNPVLTAAEWHEFVDTNKVRAGDELIISRHQVAGADGVQTVQYMIQVKRQTKTLNGEPVTVEVVKLRTSMTFQGEPM